MDRIGAIAFSIRKWTEGAVITVIGNCFFFLGREFIVFGQRMQMKAFTRLGMSMLLVPTQLILTFVSDLPAGFGYHEDDGSFTTAGEIEEMLEDSSKRIIDNIKR